MAARSRSIRQSFSTTAAGVRELGEWLAVPRDGVGRDGGHRGVLAAGVCYGLEDRFGELWLVNAHHVKNLPGRKTDVLDAEWLAELLEHGMVRGSFVPPPEIRGCGT